MKMRPFTRSLVGLAAFAAGTVAVPAQGGGGYLMMPS